MKSNPPVTIVNVIEEIKNPQLDHFHSLCHNNMHLFARKNKEYGNAFEVYGVLGVVCEILGAAARLPQLVLWAADHGKSKRESVANVLMDLHNFANMAIMCLERDNWDGRKE